MKKHLLKFLLTFIIALSVGWVNGQVTLPHYEAFDYTAASNLGDQTNWTNLFSGDEVVVTSSSLSYPDLASSTGNAISFGGSGMDPQINFTSVSSGPVYFSFIFKVTDQSSVTDLTDGGYFVFLGSGSTNYDVRLWVRANPNAASGTYDFGYGDASSSPPTTPSTYNAGDEVFVVGNYNVTTGDWALWVNPASSSFGGTEPTATISGTEASPPSSLEYFTFRQDSNGETPSVEIDELRISTTWADVTPSGGPDVTAPAGTWDPTDATTDIAIYSTPTLTFNEAILNTDASEITDANVDALVIFKETNDVGADVTVDATIDVDKKVVTITPSADLKNNQLYFVVVGPVEDADGNTTDGDTVTFTTIALKTQPENHVTGFAATANSYNSINLAWTDAVAGAQAPDAYLIKASTGAITAPVDGTDPTEDTDLSDGDAIVKVLNDGTQAYSFSGLTAGTLYNFQIWSYTNEEATIDFKLDVAGPTDNATTATTELFFSEYIEGTSNERAIEIYNGTGSSVDLSAYSVELYFNGSTSAGRTEALTGTLVNGEVYVISNPGAAGATILAESDITSEVNYFGGDDALGLLKNGVVVDVFGTIGSDPGTAWDIAGTTNASQNHTAIRKIGKTLGNNDWTSSAGTTEGDSEWIIMPQDYVNNLGAYRDVERDTTLATLTTDNGTLAPVFDAATLAYTVELPFRTIAIPTVDATANGTYATEDVVQATSIFATESERTATATVTADDLGTKDYTVIFSVALGTENDITSFIFESLDPDVTGVLDAGAHTVTATVPYGTIVTALVPTMVVSDSATVTPLTGVAQDFTNPIEYTVKAEDGTDQIWTVTVIIEENTENDITSFIFESFDPDVTGVLDAGVHTVAATVPFGTNVTALVPTITVSPDATVSPLTSVAQDFTNPVNYTVTAEDLTDQIWIVTVTVAANDAKELTSFSFVDPVVVGVITELDHTVAVEVPYGTDVTALVANFGITGTEVKVGVTTQVSGTTPNNFTSPVTYTVVAGDASEEDYIVTVTITAPATDATLSALTVDLGTLDPVFASGTYDYTVILPFGTTATPVVTATETNANANAVVVDATNVTSATAADRTTTITVTAEDASTQDYTILFNVDLGSNDATLSSLTVDNGTLVPVFDAATIDYTVELPYGTTTEPVVSATENDPNANAVITQATDVEGDLAARTATVVVTAEDASTKTYTIVFSVTAATGDIFISEYTEASTGSNKAIELFNPNATSVDLSQYVVKASHNGTGWGVDGDGDIEYELLLTGTLAAGEVYVIANASASAEILAVADVSYDYGMGQGEKVPSFNGNDALGLFKNDVLIDVIGIELVADGAGPWAVAGTDAATQDHTIIRKYGTTYGNTVWASSAGTSTANSEWMVYADGDITNLGSPTAAPTNAAPEITDVALDPVNPTSAQTVVISATITDDATAANALTVKLFHGIAAGSEDTEVTFAQVGATDVFEGTIPASAVTVFYKITANDGTLDATDYTGNYSVTAVGISNPDGIVSMNIFPNPSNGLFTLEMNASKAGTFKVEIINIQGQVIYTKEISQDGFYKDQIDISKEHSGIYYIRINDGNSMKVSKIMIQ